MPLAVDDEDDDDDNDDDEQMTAAVNIYGAIAMCQGSSKRFPYNELIHCLQQIFYVGTIILPVRLLEATEAKTLVESY